MRFGSVETLIWLWLVPALLLLALHGLLRRRADMARFASRGLWPEVAGRSSIVRPAIKAALVAASLGLVVVSLARPQWNPTPQEVRKAGRDVCFVVDVSKSMLAEDLAPNRLEKAKLWVTDVMRAVRGDRVAIVGFAGSAAVVCPLTHDYGFARTALEALGPGTVSRGGTLIGDAIRKATSEVFEEEESSFKDIILITDGEDHESFPVEAAQAAGEAGVRIIAIGIGDEDVGRPIPFTDERGRRRFVEYRGEQVLSRLDAETLKQVADASNGGVYFNVSTGTIELDRVYEDLIAQAERRELEASKAVRYDEKFQLFLAGALALLGLERLISERKRA